MKKESGEETKGAVPNVEERVIEKPKDMKVEKPKVKSKQSLSVEEFCIMKGVMNNWFSAFSLYCRRQKLLLPKTFEEWDKIFENFKRM